jgi:hypothetical protein
MRRDLHLICDRGPLLDEVFRNSMTRLEHVGREERGEQLRGEDDQRDAEGWHDSRSDKPQDSN